MAAGNQLGNNLYFPLLNPVTRKTKFVMLNSPKLNLVQELIAGASREELIWLSGYLAGIVAQDDRRSRPPPTDCPGYRLRN